jgi:hypothetical protein
MEINNKIVESVLCPEGANYFNPTATPWGNEQYNRKKAP